MPQRPRRLAASDDGRREARLTSRRTAGAGPIGPIKARSSGMVLPFSAAMNRSQGKPTRRLAHARLLSPIEGTDAWPMEGMSSPSCTVPDTRSFALLVCIVGVLASSSAWTNVRATTSNVTDADLRSRRNRAQFPRRRSSHSHLDCEVATCRCAWNRMVGGATLEKPRKNR